MIRFLLGFCFLGFFLNSQTPTWEWVRNIYVDEGSASPSYICTDSDNNVLVCAPVVDTTIIGTSTLTQIGSIYIVKYDTSGNVIWVTHTGGTGGGIIPFKIVADHLGNTYVGGRFECTSWVVGGNTLSMTSLRDHFILRLDVNGNINWSTKIDAPSDCYTLDLACDKNANLTAMGVICCNTPMTIGSFTLAPHSTLDLFLVKYNLAGNVISGLRGGSANNDSWPTLATDKKGNSYVYTNYHGAPYVFNSQTIAPTSAPNTALLFKLNSNGAFDWARSIEKAQSVLVATDTSGNSFISGRFSGTITIGTQTYGSVNQQNEFIVKYDETGNIKWVEIIGNGEVQVNSMTTDPEGNLYLTGAFWNRTLVLGPAVTLTNSSISSWNNLPVGEVFVAKYNSLGQAQWAKATVSKKSPMNGSEGHCLAADKLGNLYTSGSLRQDTYFDNDSLQNGRFLAKIKVFDPNNLVSIHENSINDNIKIFPNPANNHLTVQSDETIEKIQIFNACGSLIFNLSVKNFQKEVIINLDDFIPGVYLIKTLCQSSHSSKKLVVIN